MTEQTGESPKIVIDEGWKDRVEAEKHAAAAKQAEQHKSTAAAAQSAAAAGQSAAGSTSSSAASSASSASAEPASHAAIPAPPATLEFLVTTLATQAMMSLGQMVNPLTGKADVRLAEAKHFIDMLAVLEEKTAGNRTPDESALLDGFLHELRMAYVMSQTA